MYKLPNNKETFMSKFDVASTVSPEATERLNFIYQFLAGQQPLGKPASVQDWDERNRKVEAFIGPLTRSAADAMGVTTSDETIAGVGVVRIAPPRREHGAGHQPSGRTLVYVHGGGYVSFSAATTLILPALIAVAMGDDVISVDYTLAPRGNWQSATDQVVAVWTALIAAGAQPSSMGLFGDSAGGGMAAGAVLKMRDQGVPLPAALYLVSPWSDITATGDSYLTLTGFDPTLNAQDLSWCAEAYAAPEDQRHPYVSPVYGDYSQPFPPTLIQGGSREIFLSHFIRHYNAIRNGGKEAVLDLYDGLPHVFQTMLPAAPESRTAVARAAEFLRARLG